VGHPNFDRTTVKTVVGLRHRFRPTYAGERGAPVQFLGISVEFRIQSLAELSKLAEQEAF